MTLNTEHIMFLENKTDSFKKILSIFSQYIAMNHSRHRNY